MSTKIRYGSSLDHGKAHAQDHNVWTRRDFLTRMAAGGLAASFTLGNSTVHAYSHHPLQRILNGNQSDRVLVVFQLKGGNDGLSTVVPYENDYYYNKRPNVSIPKSEVHRLENDLGLNPYLGGLHDMYNDGKVAIVQSVGYPEPNLSHFKSTDIWTTASDSSLIQSTGVMGRYFFESTPNYLNDPPDYPLAMQLGKTSSLLMEGPTGTIGMTIQNQKNLASLARGGAFYDEGDVPETAAGNELSYLRLISNNSFKYAAAVQDALGRAENDVEYEKSDGIDKDFSVMARMIKGGLPAQLYLVSLGGFDTHRNQKRNHEKLMERVNSVITRFYQDLAATGDQERVVIMTFSEFGRRPFENGSLGTDHGTAAPLFIIGDKVAGGLHGGAQTLDSFDNKDNLLFSDDFRSVYASVLQDWLGGPPDLVDSVLGHSFDRLEVIGEPISNPVSNERAQVEAFRLEPNYPNPFTDSTRIRFTLPAADHVRLTVYDAAGKEVKVLAERTFGRGEHTVDFGAAGLSSGVYFYRLQAQQGTKTGQMTIVR